MSSRRLMPRSSCCSMKQCPLKNRYYHRSGYSPYQLVFGENPRLPWSLLSDEGVGDSGLEDVQAESAMQDSAASAFARKHQI
eukprot:3982072-Pyramimonas_sp.AAC.1